MKKRNLFLTSVFIAGVTIVLVSCQQSHDNEAEDTGDDADAWEVEGIWDGAIKVPDAPIHIVVSFQEGEELSGSISIPTQGVDDYPLTIGDNEEDKELVFTIDIAGETLSFKGDPEDDKIAGTFTQSGQEFPFELTKQDETSNETEDGAFLSIDTEDGKLYGELETPDGDGPFPVMIIIPGSGPTDRNGNTAMGDNNGLKMVAESLAEHGIASLRYDKRGAGKNKDAVTDEEEDMRFDQFIADVEAWVNELDTDKRFSRIGIFGHSQGSLVGMEAARDGAVDVYVSVAGAGSPYDELILEQLKTQLPDNLLAESEDILQHLREGETVEDVPQALQSTFRPSVQPFLMSWMQYNPREDIQALDKPTLIVNGTRDLQVTESEADKLHEAKSDAEMLIVDDMNHVLKKAPADRGGNLETYWDSDLPLADGLMEGIFDFLDETGFRK